MVSIADIRDRFSDIRFFFTVMSSVEFVDTVLLLLSMKFSIHSVDFDSVGSAITSNPVGVDIGFDIFGMFVGAMNESRVLEDTVVVEVVTVVVRANLMSFFLCTIVSTLFVAISLTVEVAFTVPAVVIVAVGAGTVVAVAGIDDDGTAVLVDFNGTFSRAKSIVCSISSNK